MTLKLFADMERKRRDLDNRAQEERKRKREQEIEEEEQKALEKEWQKNFEVSFFPPSTDRFCRLHLSTKAHILLL
jgi:hypothetical protein